MRRSPVWIAVLLVPLAGCADRDDGGGEQAPPKSGEFLAPWWPVGSWWDVDFQRGTESPQSVHLVHFWNDSATNHFWLGVTDRDGGCPGSGCGFGGSALDHALHDNNPLLGRIHWGLLTPHEKGIHANGMYSFPLRFNESFGGIMFGHTWGVIAQPGLRAGTAVLTGTATDGARIRYDYDAASMWFTYIDLKNSNGENELRVDVKSHGRNEHGVFYFLRGIDYYLGPTATGTHDEHFEVAQETPALQSLALEIKGRATGPLRIEVKNPSGGVEHEETLIQDPVHSVKEIDPPTAGRWTISYIGTGNFEGTIEVVGLQQYTQTI